MFRNPEIPAGCGALGLFVHRARRASRPFAGTIGIAPESSPYGFYTDAWRDTKTSDAPRRFVAPGFFAGRSAVRNSPTPSDAASCSGGNFPQARHPDAANRAYIPCPVTNGRGRREDL